MAVILVYLCLGKSTSLRNALSIFGAHETRITGPDTPAAAIISQAATSTIPLGKNVAANLLI